MRGVGVSVRIVLDKLFWTGLGDVAACIMMSVVGFIVQLGSGMT